ncbi:MAG: hypothetical protein K2W85_03220 [Phycisphaerales bacterium]|nr:hypothetical protein [Phycisphaerales bacterium]
MLWIKHSPNSKSMNSVCRHRLNTGQAWMIRRRPQPQTLTSSKQLGERSPLLKITSTANRDARRGRVQELWLRRVGDLAVLQANVEIEHPSCVASMRSKC